MDRSESRRCGGMRCIVVGDEFAGVSECVRTRTAILIVLLGALVAGPACKKSTATKAESGSTATGPWFENALSDSGIKFTHASGEVGKFRYPEIATAGACLFDFNGDNLLDVYFVQGGNLDPTGERKVGNQLYQNNGNLQFTNVTQRAGVDDTQYGSGCCVGDYDADGDIDLYVTNVGANVLYRNNADGTFTNVTDAAGAGDASWGTSCAFLDYDNDDRLDLFVANNLHWTIQTERNCYANSGRRDYCGPNTYNTPARDVLYRNIGNDRFQEVTVDAGLDRAYGNGLGLTVADFNRDNRLDVYVANDGMPNQLWINDGGGTFSEEALFAGCAVNVQGAAEAGMGVAAVDVENDGDFDLFMSHLVGETNTYYRNRDGLFEDVTTGVGLAAPSFSFTGFGLGFADFDHDGLIDLYVVNGAVKLPSTVYDESRIYAEPDQLYRGAGGGRFDEVMPRGGLAPPLYGRSRAAAFGDLDNDGDIDIVVANGNDRPHLLRNVAGSRGHWIMFRVCNRVGQDAIGATLKIEDVNGTQWRLVQTAYGYCSSNDPRVHVGLGSQDSVRTVTVHWVAGGTQTFGPFAAGKEYELRQSPKP